LTKESNQITIITLPFPKLSSAYSYYGITGPKTSSATALPADRAPPPLGVWQEPRRRYWRPSAVAGEIESRTRAWSLPRSIQGRCHADSDTPWRRVWTSLVLALTASATVAAVV